MVTIVIITECTTRQTITTGQVIITTTIITMGHTNGQTTITVQGTIGITMATGKTSRITSITGHITPVSYTHLDVYKRQN